MTTIRTKEECVHHPGTKLVAFCPACRGAVGGSSGGLSKSEVKKHSARQNARQRFFSALTKQLEKFTPEERAEVQRISTTPARPKRQSRETARKKASTTKP